MADVAWTDVLNATDNDPILVAFVSGGRTLILNVVNTELDPNMFDGVNGPNYFLARCLLAAHMAAVAKLGATGALASESEGGVSRSYFMPPLSWNTYMRTSYGALFWELIGPQAFAPRLL